MQNIQRGARLHFTSGLRGALDVGVFEHLAVYREPLQLMKSCKAREYADN